MVIVVVLRVLSENADKRRAVIVCVCSVAVAAISLVRAVRVATIEGKKLRFGLCSSARPAGEEEEKTALRALVWLNRSRLLRVQTDSKAYDVRVLVLRNLQYEVRVQHIFIQSTRTVSIRT